MIKSIKLYLTLFRKFITNQIVNNIDYKSAYNDVAATYNLWLDKMAQFTDNIIKPEYIAKESPIKLLDFACGTGYISRKIVNANILCDITAVDISENMLRECGDLPEKGVELINIDGLEFLDTTTEKFDMILCGWALCYFQHKPLFQKFRKVLKNNGIVGVIANSKGTLDKIEDIFIEVMKENSHEIDKPMNISMNLPGSRNELQKWFLEENFTAISTGEGEITFNFNTADELLDWLNKTGALAGSARIFKNYDGIKEQIIQKITAKKRDNNSYSINHKFVYGLFRYEEK